VKKTEEQDQEYNMKDDSDEEEEDVKEQDEYGINKLINQSK